MQFPSLPHRALVLRLTLLLAVALLPAACGDLPEPFIGNPGATARLLAMPITPPMLAVPPPDGALLGARAKDDFAELLALSLQNEEVPSLARKPEKKDWQLRVSAQRSGDLVVPRYAIFDPSGHEQVRSTVARSPRPVGQLARLRRLARPQRTRRRRFWR